MSARETGQKIGINEVSMHVALPGSLQPTSDGTDGILSTPKEI